MGDVFLLFENKKQTSFIHSWIWWFLWFFLPCRFSRFRAHWPSAKNRIFSDFAFASFFLVFQQLNSHGSRLSVLDWFQSRADCWDFVFFLATASRFVFFFGSPFSLRKSFVSFWSESLFTRRPLRRRCFLEGFLAVWRFKENNGPDWPLRFIFLNKNGAGGPVRSNTFPFGDLRTVSFFLGGGEIDFYRVFFKEFQPIIQGRQHIVGWKCGLVSFFSIKCRVFHRLNVKESGEMRGRSTARYTVRFIPPATTSYFFWNKTILKLKHQNTLMADDEANAITWGFTVAAFSELSTCSSKRGS